MAYFVSHCLLLPLPMSLSYKLFASVTMSFTRTGPEASEQEGTWETILFIPLVCQRKETKPRETEWLSQSQPACWRKAGPEHREASPCRDAELWRHRHRALSPGPALAV